MKNKLNLMVIFGGRSAEHEISLLSARNVIAALSRRKYNIFPIGLDKAGRFFLYSSGKEIFVGGKTADKIRLSKGGERVSFSFGPEKEILGLKNKKLRKKIDVVFLVLHGSFGEDGTIQGLLEMADLPYIGAGVFSSAAAMDKEISKILLAAAGIKTARCLVFNSWERKNIKFDSIAEKFGLPFFVKPAATGSSAGVSKIKDRAGFSGKIEEAFQFSEKILLEEAIEGREIECSVLGNEKPEASLPGEVIPAKDFYSYSAKYLEDDGAELIAPAKLNGKEIKNIQEISKKAFSALGGEGMARVDGFLKKNGQFIVNELNTIPRFTAISMYPKLWEKSSLALPDLLDELIDLALIRAERKKKIKLSYF